MTAPGRRVTYSGPDIFQMSTRSPSGSVAMTFCSTTSPSKTVMSAGWLRIGGLFGIAWTTIVKEVCFSSAPSLAATAAPYLPFQFAGGTVRWMFPLAEPDPGLTVVTVIQAGPKTLEKVIGSPSASLANTDWSRVDPWGTKIVGVDAIR